MIKWIEALVSRRDLVLGTAAGISTPPTDQAAASIQPRGAAEIWFRQTGAGARWRSVSDELRERVTITQFGARSGEDATEAVAAALHALGTERAAALVFPAGEWRFVRAVDWTPWRNITFRFEPGATMDHGDHPFILPERVDFQFGATLRGNGPVRMANRDAPSEEPLEAPLPDGFERAGNFAAGPGALARNRSGTNNFAWGLHTLGSNTYGGANIAIGNYALASNIGDNRVGEGSFTCHGWNNIAIGDYASRDCQLGYENLAVGPLALRNNVDGKWNVALGHNSQIMGTTNDCNISIGAYTLTKVVTSNNLAIGWSALEVAITGGNCAVGHASQNASVTATRNTSLGALTLSQNIDGNDNVAIGQETLKNSRGGNGNTACGAFALGQAFDRPTNNTAVGFQALLSSRNGQGCTAVGAGALSVNLAFDNATGIGLNAQVTGSNQLQLGNPETTVHVYAPVQLRSDARDKADIRDTVLGLDFINALRPRDFRWDLRDDYRHVDKLTTDAAPESLSDVRRDGSQKRARYHQGLIAQELKAAMDELGVDCSAYQDHRIAGGEDVRSIAYDALIPPLIKAIQELTEQNDTLTKRIVLLEERHSN